MTEMAVESAEPLPNEAGATAAKVEQPSLRFPDASFSDRFGRKHRYLVARGVHPLLWPLAIPVGCALCLFIVVVAPISQAFEVLAGSTCLALSIIGLAARIRSQRVRLADGEFDSQSPFALLLYGLFLSAFAGVSLIVLGTPEALQLLRGAAFAALALWVAWELWDLTSARVARFQSLAVAPPAGLVRKSEDDGERLSRVPARELRPHDRLFLETGEYTPGDVRLEQGSLFVLERDLSGLLLPRVKHAGDEIHAGSRIVTGAGVGELLAVWDDSNSSQFSPEVSKLIEAVPSSALVGQALIPRGFSVVLFFSLALLVFNAQSGGSATHGILLSLIPLALSPLFLIAALYRQSTGLEIVHWFRNGVLARVASALSLLPVSKRWYIELNRSGEWLPFRVKGFSLIDERISQQGLLEAVFGMVGSGDEEWHRALVDFLVRSKDVRSFCAVRDHSIYERLGICAVIEGAEFSVGSEEFLVARGVQFSSNEVSQGAEKLLGRIYVAVGEDPIAYFDFERAPLGDLVHRLRKRGVLPFFWSSALRGDELERVARDEKIDPANVLPEETPKSMARKAAERNSSALFYLLPGERALLEERRGGASVVASHFDPMRWNAEGMDLLVFERGFEPLLSALDVSRRLVRFRSTLVVGVTMLFLASLVTLFVLPAAVFLVMSVNIWFAVLAGVWGLSTDTLSDQFFRQYSRR